MYIMENWISIFAIFMFTPRYETWHICNTDKLLTKHKKSIHKKVCYDLDFDLGIFLFKYINKCLQDLLSTWRLGWVKIYISKSLNRNQIQIHLTVCLYIYHPNMFRMNPIKIHKKWSIKNAPWSFVTFDILLSSLFRIWFIFCYSMPTFLSLSSNLTQKLSKI